MALIDKDTGEPDIHETPAVQIARLRAENELLRSHNKAACDRKDEIERLTKERDALRTVLKEAGDAMLDWHLLDDEERDEITNKIHSLADEQKAREEK